MQSEVKDIQMSELDFLPEEKPSRKPDLKTNGRLFQWKDSDYKVFVPSKPKEAPSREVLWTGKGLTYYRNEGEGKSSYSIHCNVDSDVKDPAATLLQRVQDALVPLCTKEKEVKVCNYVIEREDLKAWFRRKQKKLCLHIVLDAKNPPATMQTELYKKILEVNQLIASKGYDM